MFQVLKRHHIFNHAIRLMIANHDFVWEAKLYLIQMWGQVMLNQSWKDFRANPGVYGN